MSAWWLPIGAALLVVLAWCYMNHRYRLIYGRRLRWPYFWAAHGLVLSQRRAAAWERLPDHWRVHDPWPTRLRAAWCRWVWCRLVGHDELVKFSGTVLCRRH